MVLTLIPRILNSKVFLAVFMMGLALAMLVTFSDIQENPTITGRALGLFCSEGITPNTVFIGGGDIQIEVGSGNINDPECSFTAEVDPGWEGGTCIIHLQRNSSAILWSLLASTTSPLGCSSGSSCGSTESLPATIQTYNYVCLAPGRQNIRCALSDVYFSSTKYIDCVDTTNPNAFPRVPANAATTEDDLIVSCNATDNWDVNQVKLWLLTPTGSWHINASASSISGSNYTLNKSLNNTPSGNYSWKCEVSDDGNRAVNSSTYSFTVNPANPNITISSPTGTITSSRNIPLQFSKSNADSCQYSLDGAANVTLANCGNTTFNLTTEGSHTIKIYAINGDETASDTSTFTLTTSLTVTLVYPENFATIQMNRTNFTYSVNSSDSVVNCTIVIDGSDNSTDTSITLLTNEQFNISTAPNTYLWNVRCENPTKSDLADEDWFVTTEDPPAPAGGGSINITLNSPADSASDSDGSVTFSYTANSSNTISNCSLLINNTMNVTNSSIGGAHATSTFTRTIGDGTWNWNIRCFDNADPANQGNATARTINVDSTENNAPIVSLANPADDANDTDGTITFTYSVTDSSEIENCSIIIDDSILDTDTSVANNTETSFTQNLGEATYVWAVGCYDVNNNFGTSEERNITVAFPVAATEGIRGAYTNEGERRSQSWKIILAGTRYKMSIPYSDFSVTQLGFIPNKNSANAELQIQEYRKKPTEIPQLDSPTYGYFSIHTENIDPQKTWIYLKVKTAWVRSQPQGISLYRLEENEWKEYPVTIKEQDGIYSKYEVELPGFSTFVVGAAKAPPTPLVEEAENGLAGSATKIVSQARPQKNAPANEYLNQTKSGSKWALLVVYITFVVVLSVLMIGWRTTGQGNKAFQLPSFRAKQLHSIENREVVWELAERTKQRNRRKPSASYSMEAEIEERHGRKVRDPQKLGIHYEHEEHNESDDRKT